ncbi:large conductance mechanosensitive channel protein MscL [Aestuariivirga sp.]|uniref:large conductance mechanosensitive channel protein MscL n=1 Tax=Aestuariivirga sp. TaxID=2650926 RepID=UPI0039E28A36
MWTEFKNFAFKGNAFDLAVGVIMGGAFGKIVDSIVNDLIMPVVGAVSGGADFSNYFLPLNSAVNATNYADAVKQGATLGYGNFITVLINFLILAFILFQMVKVSTRLKKAEPPAPPPPASTTETLLAEIRDALKADAKKK